MNPVTQLLKGLLDRPDVQIVHGARTFGFGDDDLPVNAGVAYVRGQFNELQRQARAQRKAEKES